MGGVCESQIRIQIQTGRRYRYVSPAGAVCSPVRRAKPAIDFYIKNESESAASRLGGGDALLRLTQFWADSDSDPAQGSTAATMGAKVSGRQRCHVQGPPLTADRCGQKPFHDWKKNQTPVAHTRRSEPAAGGDTSVSRGGFFFFGDQRTFGLEISEIVDRRHTERVREGRLADVSRTVSIRCGRESVGEVESQRERQPGYTSDDSAIKATVGTR